MRITFLRPLVLIALATGSSPAWAGGTSDQAAAAALFDQAKQLMSAGDYEHACPKLVEAQRLAPTAGTLLNIGNCYEKLGKLASAWGAFKEAEVASRNLNDSEREAEASRRAQALSVQLAKLAINVPPAARVPGFELRRDGVLVGEGQWGSALPVDAGQHTIEAKAPGRKPWSTWVRIDNNGSAATIEVPVLEVSTADSEPSAAPFWGGQRIASLVVGGVGLVGLGLAGGFAASAASKNKESKQSCSPADPNFCNDVGVSLRKDAKTAAAVSTATTIIGAAALAGGVVLFVTAPAGKPVQAGRVEVVGRIGGLAIQGRF